MHNVAAIPLAAIASEDENLCPAPPEETFEVKALTAEEDDWELTDVAEVHTVLAVMSASRGGAAAAATAPGDFTAAGMGARDADVEIILAEGACLEHIKMENPSEGVPGSIGGGSASARRAAGAGDEGHHVEIGTEQEDGGVTTIYFGRCAADPVSVP